MVIHTARLCTVSLFLDDNRDNSSENNLIECRPVVTKLPDPESPIVTIGTTDETTIDIDLIVDPTLEAVLEKSIASDINPQIPFMTLEDDFEGLGGLEEYDAKVFSVVIDPQTGEIESLAPLVDGDGTLSAERQAEDSIKSDNPKAQIAASAIKSYLIKHKTLIAEAVARERERAIKAQGLKGKVVGKVDSPRYDALTKQFDKKYDHDGEEEEKERVRDEL